MWHTKLQPGFLIQAIKYLLYLTQVDPSLLRSPPQTRTRLENEPGAIALPAAGLFGLAGFSRRMIDNPKPLYRRNVSWKRLS